MDWIVIEGIRPWDGRYEFDLETHPLTAREWGWIKRFSGYLPLTIESGIDGGDPELFAAWAVIAVRRAGRIQPAEVQDVYDRLADAPFGATITFQLGDQEEEAGAGPPPGSSDGSRSTSGTGSTPSSAPSTDDSGTPGSGTSASDPVRLAS
jgi:hypothetical protein